MLDQCLEWALANSLKTGNLDTILKEVSGAKAEQELTTSEIEEKEMALQMLSVFATELQEKYAPYVEQTTLIVDPVLTFEANTELRKKQQKYYQVCTNA